MPIQVILHAIESI